tara:strand:- start:1634 stop:1849 length:216 start_codon:yes stop_codon:yes gene_type:complete
MILECVGSFWGIYYLYHICVFSKSIYDEKQKEKLNKINKIKLEYQKISTSNLDLEMILESEYNKDQNIILQ